MRANIVISLGSLSVSKCGCAAMSSLYACLKDEYFCAKEFDGLSHLILNGMLKPSGYMAKIAVCLKMVSLGLLI